MATFPMPTGPFSNSPVFQTFLGNHDVLARIVRTGTRADINRFLTEHPEIARRWTTLVTASQTQAGQPAGPAPTAGGTGTGPAGAADPGSQETARGTLTSYLDAFHLGGVADYAWQRYLQLGEGSEETILNEIRQNRDGTGLYAQIYPGMAELNAAGRGMTEGQYRDAEESYRAAMRSYGIPAEFYDEHADFARLIVGGVSAREFDDRLQMAQRATMTDPRAVAMREQLASFYGVPNAPGLTIAWMINPDVSEELIRRQFTAAQTAAVSSTVGFGSLSQAQAERIGALGLSEDQQAQTFSSLAQMQPLTTSLPGMNEEELTSDELLQAGFESNAAAQQKLRRKQQGRAAQFAGGGAFATSQAGVTGLGTANT